MPLDPEHTVRQAQASDENRVQPHILPLCVAHSYLLECSRLHRRCAYRAIEYVPKLVFNLTYTFLCKTGKVWSAPYDVSIHEDVENDHGGFYLRLLERIV